MNLYIIRHSLAVEPGTPGFEDDSQRPLIDKGQKRMQDISRGLQALDVRLDLVLSSPYIRARQTAEILADGFKMKARPTLTESLTPMGNPDHLINEINEKYAVNNLAVVGHEPFLSELISILLTGGANMFVDMKKGSVCCLAFDGSRLDHNAILTWLLTPAQLIKIGK